MRMPSTPRSSTEVRSNAGWSIDVESSGSCPPIASSSAADSATVLENGPIWSSDEPNAIRP